MSNDFFFSDIDECMISNPCTNGTCNNTPGSYNCSCEVGYSLIDNGTTCSLNSDANNGDRSGPSPLFLYIPLCTFLLLYYSATCIIFCNTDELRYTIKFN